MYFNLFFCLVPANANALFAALYTRLDGGGKLVFDKGFDDPLQPLLEGPSGQAVAPQTVFTFGKRKCWWGRDPANRAGVKPS